MSLSPVNPVSSHRAASSHTTSAPVTAASKTDRSTYESMMKQLETLQFNGRNSNDVLEFSVRVLETNDDRLIEMLYANTDLKKGYRDLWDQNVDKTTIKTTPQSSSAPAASSSRQSSVDRRTPSGDIIGLPNVGNTCFMNTPIQCLFAMPSVMDLLRTDRQLVRERGEKPEVFVKRQEIYVILQNLAALYTQKSTDLELIGDSLKALYQAIYTSGFNADISRGARNAQNDMDTFLQVILGDVLKLGAEYHVHNKACTSDQVPGFENDAPPAFLTVIALGMRPGNNNLQDLANDFLTPELVVDKWTPDGRPAGVKAYESRIQTAKIRSDSKVLVFTVRRAEVNGRVNRAPVEVPANGLIQLPTGPNDEMQNYRVGGTANHSGGTEGGHYKAVVEKDGKCYSCNDSIISQIPNDEARRLEQSGYYFFLERVEAT